MNKIHAAVVDPNAPGHVAIHDVDAPVPARNEALVRFMAASLNQGEVRYAETMEPGHSIGWDLAGVIEQPASDGSGPPAGARVVGFVRTGAWAEMVAVPTNSLAVLPDNVTFEEASTLPVAGLTALYMLEKGHGLLGRNVLVTGANGGVGLFALQLAKLMGADVTALIRREEYRDLVKKHGADHVVVSEDGGAACDHAPYRLIAESVGGQVLANCLSLIEPDGICVTIGNSSQTETTFNAWTIIHNGRTTLYGFILFTELGIEPASVGLARLAKLVSEGKLKPQITVEEPFDKVGEVARDLMDRKIPGKAVIRMWI